MIYKRDGTMSNGWKTRTGYDGEMENYQAIARDKKHSGAFSSKWPGLITHPSTIKATTRPPIECEFSTLGSMFLS